MKGGKAPDETGVSGYTFPPEQHKEYDYNDYYMHYYQEAYHMWSGMSAASWWANKNMVIKRSYCPEQQH